MADESARKLFKGEVPLKQVTCKGPMNIAVIKYWGKRDEELVLPVNSSLSITVNIDELHTVTTVAASSTFMEDCLWLNGRKQDIAKLPRIQKCLLRIKELSEHQHQTSNWEVLKDCHVHVCSQNNFPTAAGLASSAAGYACLVFALSKLFQVNGELSVIARQGSGSACRSIYGGFVKWERGDAEDGTDSIAKQVVTSEHWSDLRILILVVSESKKATSSTEGMKRSVATSDLLKLRAEFCVPQRMKIMEKAIRDKDFKTFAETTMKDSNQLHAVCLDTYPPISPPYMNLTSHQVIQIVTQYNQFYQQLKAAYSFDAGPNAVLFFMEKDIAEVVALVRHFFPPSEDSGFIRGIPCDKEASLNKSLLDSITVGRTPGAIKYVISTKAGKGPCVLDDICSLLDENGFPKSRQNINNDNIVVYSDNYY